MALFTDSSCVSPADLLALDGECQTALSSSAKLGQPTPLLADLCAQNWVECRAKLEAALASFSTYIGSSGMESHLAQVFNTGLGTDGARARIRLNQIITSDTYYGNSTSTIQRWMTYSALMLVFQTMSNRLDSKDKTGDRYEKKRAFYEKEKNRLWLQLLSQGLPWTLSYLPRPAATHEFNSGTWDNTCLSFQPGVTAYNEPIQLRVAITYVDTSLYLSPLLKKNAESAPSDILGVLVNPGQQLNISIASLNPPNPATAPVLGVSQPVAPMMTATAWHIYCGVGNGPMFLQTVNSPIPISLQSYTLVGFTFAGYVMGQGQIPNGGEGNLIFGSRILRG